MATGTPTTFNIGGLAQAQADLTDSGKRPVTLSLTATFKEPWTFPLEPQVSVKAGKTIVRRNIAKKSGSGTVKEQWGQDDYEISFTGLLQGNDLFPEKDFSKLQSFLRAGQSVFIRCMELGIIGIDRICIASWEFPHTAGIENQEFTISAYSDQYFELI